MRSYEDSEFERGTKGEAPSIFGPGLLGTEEGQKAREAGYREYLSNKSLVDQMREAQEAKNRSSSSDNDSGNFSNSSTSVLGEIWAALLSSFVLAFIPGSILGAFVYSRNPKPHILGVIHTAELETIFSHGILPMWVLVFFAMIILAYCSKENN